MPGRDDRDDRAAIDSVGRNVRAAPHEQQKRPRRLRREDTLRYPRLYHHQPIVHRLKRAK